MVGEKTARPGNGLTLKLEMGLPPGADPLATIQTQQVNCADGSALGAPEAAITRLRLTHSGGLASVGTPTGLGRVSAEPSRPRSTRPARPVRM